MRTTLIITMLFVITTVQSQTTNRYGSVTTSSFKPLSSDVLHLQAELWAKESSKSITRNIEDLYFKINYIISTSSSEYLKDNLSKSTSLLNSIVLANRIISIPEAEKRVSKAYKAYNHAIKLENKRITALNDIKQFEIKIVQDLENRSFSDESYKKGVKNILNKIRECYRNSSESPRKLKAKLKKFKKEYRRINKDN